MGGIFLFCLRTRPSWAASFPCRFDRIRPSRAASCLDVAPHLVAGPAGRSPLPGPLFFFFIPPVPNLLYSLTVCRPFHPTTFILCPPSNAKTSAYRPPTTSEKRDYFVTICCQKRKPYLAKNENAGPVLEFLQSSATRESFAIHAYCAMPDHLHFLASQVPPTSAIC